MEEGPRIGILSKHTDDTMMTEVTLRTIRLECSPEIESFQMLLGDKIVWSEWRTTHYSLKHNLHDLYLK